MGNNKQLRFVPVKQLEEICRARLCSSLSVLMYCKCCGDTIPKHGFYPLFSNAYGGNTVNLSSVTCNRCALSDEEYLERFGEPKEIIE